MTFGDNLKELRESRNLSQEDLAGILSEKMGTSRNKILDRQTISNWERSKSLPEMKKALHLSVLFNVSLDQLFAGELEELRQAYYPGSELEEEIPGAVAGLKLFAENLEKLKRRERSRKERYGRQQKGNGETGRQS